MAFRWRIGNKPELSMCPPSPILHFAAACSRHQSDTMWHVTQCDKIFDNVILDLPKGKRCIGLWGRNSSGGDWPHCRDRNQCLISPGMSKHILGWPSDSAQKICLIWIHRDPHPHLMEFSRLWYVMIALYSLWLYESMIIHINPWYSKESSGIFGIRPAWTGHQICSGLGRSSQWRPRCWLQWPGAGDGFGDGLVR